MHRLPSKKAILKFRLAALLLLLRHLLLLAAVVLFIVATINKNQESVLWAVFTLGACVVVGILQWVVALQTKCPLCITPVLGNKNCSKNKRSKTLLGSYRLRVVVHILTLNRFRCPYCSEPTALEVRPHRQR